ncbi:thioredoxin-like isoform X3 [Dreissena polymorpha]|nr:thioredoxin-like isoform X3 [Dreissena polymorpha]
MVKFIENLNEFKDVMRNSEGKLVVVDFTASWCGPCKHIAPKFEQLSKDNTDVLFFKVDVDANSETSEDQEISCMPTFKFYKNGEVLHVMEGADEKGLVAKILELK